MSQVTSYPLVIKKRRLKDEKLAKFEAKREKQQSAHAAANHSKNKVEKVKKTTEVDAYNPRQVEDGRYEWWESRGYFKPEFTAEGKVKDEGKFVIPIPPPNVTGSLHMGHALTNALQDTMIRHSRMRGKTTAWIPGFDHASISTQSVVEKMLWKTEHKTRHDVGRSRLLEMIWEWTHEYKASITYQLKALGGSMDWSREAFTMDENLSEAVKTTFIQLHEEGVIYRANRLVNWCTALNTTISNLEVDNQELSGRTKLAVPGYERKIEFGYLTYFKYPICKSSQDFSSAPTNFADYDTIEVATTRPETMLGDVAIAVHPSDERYAHLVGTSAIHPFVLGRKIKIIADDEVDTKLGTGAVKITPAHDHADFAKSKRHGLDFINILNDNGTLNSNCARFAGLKRFDARDAVIEELQKLNLFSKMEDHAMPLPRCQRTKDIIEPILKPQWWMKMSSMADVADKAVSDGRIIIKPELEEKRFHQWMQNIQDWCLSRQLWWGHRPPAYLVCVDGEEVKDADNNYWVCANDEAEARTKAAQKFPGKKFNLHWDEDVLDTWFSSGLWPWAIMGWPKKTHDYETLYPTSVLETGWDILFFWVARMIMLGLKMTGQVPFTEVYCHSLIRDSEGRKMSKSLGNVIDPLDIINGIALEDLCKKLLTGNLDPTEVDRAKNYQRSIFPKGIPACGTDALRFTLVNYTTGGGDIAFDIKEIEAKRRFCNKIYQAVNFTMGSFNSGFVPNASPLDHEPKCLAERWILHRLNQTALEVSSAIEARNFSVATIALYQYWLRQLCDAFIENSKAILHPSTHKDERNSAQQTLYTALEGGLLMLHPIMPYITEYLWQKLPRRKGDTTESIMVARFPEFTEERNAPQAAMEYDLVLDIAGSIRGLLSEYKFKEKGDVLIRVYSDSAMAVALQEQISIKSLAGKYVADVEVSRSDPNSAAPKAYAVRSVNPEVNVYLKITGKVDFATDIARS